MDTLFEIKLARPAPGTRHSGIQLYTQLRAAILDGRLAPGLKLPVRRDSQRLLGVSRNTAAKVYERLASEGLIASRRGSGSYVARPRPQPLRNLRSPSTACDPRLNPFWLEPHVTHALGFWRDSNPKPRNPSAPIIDFRPALMDLRLFPFDVFRQVSVKQLRGMERKLPSYKSPQGNQGHFPLREAISQHIGFTRAVVCEADEVLVTAGAQQAFDILARVLVTPGATTVAIEDPGYPPLRVAFAAAGAKIVPIGVDAEGLMVDSLPSDTRVICVCPSHQFPLGVAMSIPRRQALLEFACRRGAVIIEDDYDGEFRFDDSPLEALRSADPRGLVFYVGTFSKCMMPALRLGFVVAPDWAMRSMIAVKNSLDWHCPTTLQMVVARFIADGHLIRHLRKMRETYGERRRLVLAMLQREFADRLKPIPSAYGMHVAAFARGSFKLERMTADLLDANVNIHSLRRYFLGSPSAEGLIFGYGAADRAQIVLGMSLLRQAWIA